MNMVGGGSSGTEGNLKVKHTTPVGSYNKMAVTTLSSVSSGIQIDTNKFISGANLYVYENGVWKVKPISGVAFPIAYVLAAKTSWGYVLVSTQGSMTFTHLIESDTSAELISMTTSGVGIHQVECATNGRYFTSSGANVYELTFDHDTVTGTLLFTTTNVNTRKLLYYNSDNDQFVVWDKINSSDGGSKIRWYDSNGSLKGVKDGPPVNGVSMSTKTIIMGENGVSLGVLEAKSHTSGSYTTYLHGVFTTNANGYVEILPKTNRTGNISTSLTAAWLDGNYFAVTIKVTVSAASSNTYLYHYEGALDGSSCMISKRELGYPGALTMTTTDVFSGIVIDQDKNIWMYS